MSKHRKLIFVVVALLILPVLLLGVASLTSSPSEDLGVNEGRFAPCPDSPNCVSTQAIIKDSEHYIAPIPLGERTSAEALANIKAAIGKLPRTKIVEESERYLQAESTSLIFRFVDDVEFWIDESGKQIHFRSASRVGYSDPGKNRQRMEHLRTQLTN